MIHTINRLQFQFNCSDEDQAFNFRENFGVTFQEQITDAVDIICSAYVSKDEWLRIDKLEIDLGYFSPDSFDANFAASFKYKFEKELAQKLSAISSTEKKVLQQRSKKELFQHFLQTGILPWWASESEINIDEIAIDLITHYPEVIKQFFYHYQHKRNIWLRTALQLTQKNKALIVSLIGELKTTKELFLRWIQQLNILLKNESATALQIDDETLENIILKQAPDIFRHIKDENFFLEIFEKNIAAIFTDIKSINKIIVENKPIFLQVYSEMFNNDVSKDVLNKIDIHQNPEQGKKLLEDTIIFNEENEKIIIEKHTVKHAGIILLAPFLKSFFTNLNLLHNEQWKTKDAQYRAVHLLKFLSTGTQKMPEYNLTLEKIICGLHIEEPIPFDINLEESEINEAVSLLESVIEHWKALKNTSVNGLRESFLKRDGLLSEKENDWLLQVERKTLDILIDSIPWGYSTISLPWNYNLIFVEW